MSKIFKYGLILGKFSPFHEGHKLMIDYAMDMSEMVHILVNGETDIPIATRVAWLEEEYAGKRVAIHHIQRLEDIPDPAKYDEFGTAVDPEFWKAWIDGIQQAFWCDFDAVFSNDQYGAVLADKLGATWMPVDIDRTTQDISGSAIRGDPDKYYDYLTEVAKPYYQKTIAIVGPESTGKSTMAKKLALFYDYGYAHEYGRTLSEIRNNELTEDDFRAIGIGQQQLIESAHKQHRVVITDTEAFTTYLYGEVYISDPAGRLMRELLDSALEQQIDLYLLLAPTVKWHDDGTRVMRDLEKRQEFFEQFKTFLDENDRKYVIIDDENWDSRFVQAVNSITYD